MKADAHFVGETEQISENDPVNVLPSTPFAGRQPLRGNACRQRLRRPLSLPERGISERPRYSLTGLGSATGRIPSSCRAAIRAVSAFSGTDHNVRQL